MAHRTARLNVFGRRLLVAGSTAGRRRGPPRPGREPHDGAQVGPLSGRGLGRARGSSPVRIARRAASPDGSEAILRARSSGAGARIGSARSRGIPARPSTGPGPPGFSRLRDSDRSSGVPVRYVRDHPGELVHQDHKKLGRIPEGGGHRMLGQASGRRHRRGAIGYDHLEVIVDDATRLAYVALVPDESAAVRRRPSSTQPSGSPATGSASSGS